MDRITGRGKTEHVRRDGLLLTVDRNADQFQQRMARRLHIHLQHLTGIAPGDKDIRADDLGRIAVADAQKFGRQEKKPHHQPGQCHASG